MAEKTLIAAAKTFEQRNIDAGKRAGKAGFIVGAAGLLLAIMCMGVVIIMLPLKQTKVELYTVDNHTGDGQFVTSVSRSSLTAQEAVERAGVARYIKMREGYNYFQLQSDYDTVQLFGTPDVNNAFLAWYAGKSAPDEVYQKAAYVVNVDIISSQISDSTSPDRLATVRFKKTIRKVADNAIQTEYWDVRMTFHYEPDREMKARDREANPLGFTVTSYQRDKEIRGGE